MNLFLYSLLFFSLPIILAAHPTDADSRQIIVNLPCSSNPSRHFTLTAKRISARVGALDIGEVELFSPINGPWTNVSCTRTSRKNSTTVIAHLHFTTNREDLTVLLQPHFTVTDRGGWECTRALVAFGLFKGNETERELAWTLGGKELEAISWRASSRERGFKCHNSRLGVNSANRVDFDDLRILPHAEMGADEMRESGETHL